MLQILPSFFVFAIVSNPTYHYGVSTHIIAVPRTFCRCFLKTYVLNRTILHPQPENELGEWVKLELGVVPSYWYGMVCGGGGEEGCISNLTI